VCRRAGAQAAPNGCTGARSSRPPEGRRSVQAHAFDAFVAQQPRRRHRKCRHQQAATWVCGTGSGLHSTDRVVAGMRAEIEADHICAGCEQARSACTVTAVAYRRADMEGATVCWHAKIAVRWHSEGRAGKRHERHGIQACKGRTRPQSKHPVECAAPAQERSSRAKAQRGYCGSVVGGGYCKVGTPQKNRQPVFLGRIRRARRAARRVRDSGTNAVDVCSSVTQGMPCLVPRSRSPR